MGIGYITNGTTQDGFGARLQRAINTMAFTFYLRDKMGVNLVYIHTPFSFEGFGENFGAGEGARAIGDNAEPYNENCREGYLKRAVLWDDNIKFNGTTINQINLNNIQIINTLDFDKTLLISDATKKNINNKIYFVKYLQRETNSGLFDINLVNTYFSEIKKCFEMNVSTISNDIIIHIRRKDAINYGTERYLDDEYYLEILQALIPFKNKYNITIHTQRKNFNYNKFIDWQVIYDDEEEDYELFKKMVSAKVLIVGKSSFSLAAGYLNQNVVVYPNQGNKGLDRWINKEQYINILKYG